MTACQEELKVFNSALKALKAKENRLWRTMEILVSSFIDNSQENLSDEEFMKIIEQLDESELSSPPFSELQSSECTKVGKKCIKFMSYGQL